MAAAYRGGTPLDIEWVEGFEHQSTALTSATQMRIRMVQSGSKARLEQGGMLYVSDGVHDRSTVPRSMPVPAHRRSSAIGAAAL